MAKSKSAYSDPGKKGKLDTHRIVVWVDNEAGVLARVVGLFSGRGYNIESLAVAEVDPKRGISRITIVTTGTPQVIEQIKLQLGKLVPVFPYFPTVKTLFLNLIFSPFVTGILGIQFFINPDALGVMGLFTILIACSFKEAIFKVFPKIPCIVPPIPSDIPLNCLRVS